MAGWCCAGCHLFGFLGLGLDDWLCCSVSCCLVLILLVYFGVGLLLMDVVGFRMLCVGCGFEFGCCAAVGLLIGLVVTRGVAGWDLVGFAFGICFSVLVIGVG